MLHTPTLRLQTPAMFDQNIMLASGSDSQAQRWLGWPDRVVVPERKRERLLGMSAGKGPALSPTSELRFSLAAIDPGDGRLAGVVAIDPDTREVGGWLAPRFRGRGLGVVLFGGVAEFAHHHLGIPVVTAGAEPGNAACIGALSSAGFTATAGPDTHIQANGQVIPATWFRHESVQPTKCGI